MHGPPVRSCEQKGPELRSSSRNRKKREGERKGWIEGEKERGADVVREEIVGLKKKKAEPIKVRPMVLLPTEKASLGIVIKHPTRAHQILLS